MGSTPLDRLRAIAWSSAVLAVTAAVEIGTQAYRATTMSTRWDGVRFANWQRPFLDGPSLTALFLTLGAAVLLFMLPSATLFAAMRRFTARLLVLCSAANVALGVGYLLTSYVSSDGVHRTWVRPPPVVIAIYQVPLWGMAIVTLFMARAASAPSTVANVANGAAGRFAAEARRRSG